MYPKLCQHWQVIWMMAAAMLVLTVVLGLYGSHSSCVEQADGSLGKSTCSAAQRDSWWSSGLQHEQPTEQSKTQHSGRALLQHTACRPFLKRDASGLGMGMPLLPSGEQAGVPSHSAPLRELFTHNS